MRGRPPGWMGCEPGTGARGRRRGHGHGWLEQDLGGQPARAASELVELELLEQRHVDGLAEQATGGRRSRRTRSAPPLGRRGGDGVEHRFVSLVHEVVGGRCGPTAVVSGGRGSGGARGVPCGAGRLPAGQRVVAQPEPEHLLLGGVAARARALGRRGPRERRASRRWSCCRRCRARASGRTGRGRRRRGARGRRCCGSGRRLGWASRGSSSGEDGASGRHGSVSGARSCAARSARVAALGQPPVGADQPEVQDRMRDLGAPARLEVRQQLDLPGVVGPLVQLTERDGAVRVVAAAERAWREVSRGDAPGLPADDAPAGGCRSTSAPTWRRGSTAPVALAAGRASWACRSGTVMATADARDDRRGARAAAGWPLDVAVPAQVRSDWTRRTVRRDPQGRRARRLGGGPAVTGRPVSRPDRPAARAPSSARGARGRQHLADGDGDGGRTRVADDRPARRRLNNSFGVRGRRPKLQAGRSAADTGGLRQRRQPEAETLKRPLPATRPIS